MVEYGPIIISPLKLMVKEPKIVLGGILKWIPGAVGSVLLLNFIFSFPDMGSQFVNAIMNGNSRALGQMFSQLFQIFIQYLPYILLTAILSVAASILVQLYYAQLVQQRLKKGIEFPDGTGKAIKTAKGEISMDEALGTALSKFFDLFWAYFVFASAILLLALVTITIFALLFVVSPILGIVVLLLGLLGLIFTALLISMVGWLLPSVVVLSSTGGVDAVTKSYSIVRRTFGSTFIVYLVVVAMSSIFTQIFQAANSIPYAGLMINLMVGLFMTAWVAMAPAEYYWEMVSAATKK